VAPGGRWKSLPRCARVDENMPAILTGLRSRRMIAVEAATSAPTTILSDTLLTLSPRRKGNVARFYAEVSNRPNRRRNQLETKMRGTVMQPERYVALLAQRSRCNRSYSKPNSSPTLRYREAAEVVKVVVKQCEVIAVRSIPRLSTPGDIETLQTDCRRHADASKQVTAMARRWVVAGGWRSPARPRTHIRLDVVRHVEGPSRLIRRARKLRYRQKRAALAFTAVS